MNKNVSKNPYTNPDIAQWLGCFEGVPFSPDTPAPAPTQGGGHFLNDKFNWLGVILPGVSLAWVMAIASQWLSKAIGVQMLGFDKSPISAIALVIVIGLLIRNTIGVPIVYESGLKFCIKKILRFGIALLGIRLSLLAAGKIGIIALPIVFGCILSALFLVTFINRRLGLSPRLGSLIAVGTSICGVSAIVATAPTIDAEDDEISYAVACVALFGLTALFVYPFLAHWLFQGNATEAGFFLGTTIHDTSQVAGASLMYQQQFDAPTTLNTAVVTKLVRNLCMIWVIPLLSYRYHRDNILKEAMVTPKWYKMIPVFLLGFLAMTFVRTVGDMGGQAFGLIDHATWKEIVLTTKQTAGWCLVLAMASVGLSTSLKKSAKLGFKPLLVGFAASALVGVVSFMLINVVASYITIPS